MPSRCCASARPTATLQAARVTFPEGRLFAVFQPHLYTRTQDQAEEFGRALLGADMAVITSTQIAALTTAGEVLEARVRWLLMAAIAASLMSVLACGIALLNR